MTEYLVRGKMSRTVYDYMRKHFAWEQCHILYANTLEPMEFSAIMDGSARKCIMDKYKEPDYLEISCKPHLPVEEFQTMLDETAKCIVQWFTDKKEENKND